MVVEGIRTWKGPVKALVVMAHVREHPFSDHDQTNVRRQIDWVSRYVTSESYRQASIEFTIIDQPVDVGKESMFHPKDKGWDFGQLMNAGLRGWYPTTQDIGDSSKFNVALVVINENSGQRSNFFAGSEHYWDHDALIARAYSFTDSGEAAFAHELFHSITAIGDHYEGWNNSGNYDLMGQHGHEHHSAYSKYAFGWLTPDDPTQIHTTNAPILIHQPAVTETVSLRAMAWATDAPGPRAIWIPVDDDVEYWVDYRRAIRPLEEAIPANDEVLVWYVNRRLSPIPHIRAELEEGESYKNASLGVRVPRKANTELSRATVNVNRYPTSLAVLAAPGPNALFAHQAWLLSWAHTFNDPRRDPPDATGHFAWAQGKTPEELAVELEAMIQEARDVLLNQAEKGKAAFAWLYALIARSCADTGVNLGQREPSQIADGGVNSTDLRVHFEDALREMGTGPTGKGQGIVLDRIKSRYQGLMFFCTEHPDHLLRCLYVAESIHLTRHGVFASHSRNEPVPGRHWAWVRKVTLDALRAELKDKYNEQGWQHAGQGISVVAAWYAENAVRLNQYGIDHGSPTEKTANSMQLEVHAGWATNAGAISAIEELHRRVDDLFAALD